MAANTTTATYIQQLAAARHTHSTATKALTLALKHVEPTTAEFHAIFLTMPADYAEALRKKADIVASLPTLRTAVEIAAAALAPLEDRACHRCNGSGQYYGATNAVRRGIPYCFYCNGSGHKKG